MRRIIATVLIVGAAAATAAARQADSGGPQVQIGLFKYAADGSLSGMAYEDDQVAPNSIVWVGRGQCQMGASSGSRSGRPPAAATDAWRFSGKVLSATRDVAVVQLDWQRLLDDGRPTMSPQGSQQLTLTPGQPLMLDSVMPEPACGPSPIVLEARYEPNLVRRAVHAFRAVGSGSGSGAEPGGAGSVAGGGSGGMSVSGRAVHVTTTAREAGAGAGGGSGRTAGAALAGDARVFDVHLWLVHTAPKRDEAVVHQTLRAGPGGADFAFAPITVDHGGQPLTVQVTGSFGVTTPPGQEEQFVFTTNRRVMATPRNQMPRDAAAGMLGTSRTTNAMPGPDDVLSFELPPVRPSPGSPAVPDQFSLRVRISRSSKGE